MEGGGEGDDGGGEKGKREGVVEGGEKEIEEIGK